jgi:hypothetical protein
MCGGPWAMGRGDIIREAGTSLGYVGGSEHSSPNGNIPLTYNQSNNLGKWASQVETINLENMTPTQCIKIIANNVSKHLGVIITDHMWYKDSTYTTLYTGSKTKKFSQYLKNVEDVLQFCNDNDIQVVTYKDVLKSLYETTPDPHLNILPPLYADLTNQGYPDGYSLSAKTTLVKNDGVAEDHNYSLCKNGDGSIFYIENIGGFEKGENVLSFYAKGADNAVVQLNINNPKVDLTYQKVVVPIKGATNSFVKFKTKLNIPSDVDLLTLRFYVSNNTSKDFYISGLYIGKED